MDYWNRKHLSRRRLLRGGAVGALGLAGAALIGCGDDDDDDDGGTGATATATATGTQPSDGTVTVQDVPRGGTLRIGQSAEPQSFDPHLGTSGGERQYLHLMYDRLVNTDKSGLLDPSRSLAESWEFPEPTTVLLHLRPDVFIAGTDEAVDADLVAWNLERASAPGATSRSELADLESVDVVDATLVRLNLSQPSAPLLTNLTDRSGCIISRRKVEELGEDDFARQPLGSGPFQLREWVSDARIVFDRNPDYWGVDSEGRAKPYLDTVHNEIIPDNTVRVAALEAGDIDVTPTPSDDYARLQEDSSLKVAIFNGSHTLQYYINHSAPPFDDLRFRRAFSFALDRETWVKTFAKGEETLGIDILTPASWAWDNTIDAPSFDPAEVRRLLEASNYSEDEWVISVLPTGQDSLTDEDVYWEDHMAQFGIKYDFLQPERGGWGTRLFTGLGGDGTAHAFRSSWSMRLDPDGNIGQFYLQNAGYNSGQAPVSEVEPLVVQARESVVVEERRELYKRIQELALENMYSTATIAYNIAASHARSRVGNLDFYYGGEGKERWAEVWVEDA